MIIGFTGTRHGMTAQQIAVLRSLLNQSQGEFHHGDCVGADGQAHDIAVGMGYEPVIHPPSDNRLRAYKSAKRIEREMDYIDRNKNIVRRIELVIAAPNTQEESMRSGTWSTIRFARKLGRKLIIILPNGDII